MVLHWETFGVSQTHGRKLWRRTLDGLRTTRIQGIDRFWMGPDLEALVFSSGIHWFAKTYCSIITNNNDQLTPYFDPGNNLVPWRDPPPLMVVVEMVGGIHYSDVDELVVRWSLFSSRNKRPMVQNPLYSEPFLPSSFGLSWPVWNALWSSVYVKFYLKKYTWNLVMNYINKDLHFWLWSMY